MMKSSFASRQADGTAFDQLNHTIDVMLADVVQFEHRNRRYSSLGSLYTTNDHQLQGGLIYQH